MEARLRSWWQHLKRYQRANILVLVMVVCIVFITIFLSVGYSFEWTGHGGYYKVTTQTTVSDNSKPTTTTTKEYVPPKTLWDWLNFLFIGLITTMIAFLTNVYSNRQKATELNIATDKQRGDALQSYIDKISALLLEKDLRDPVEVDKVRKIGRVRTLTVLPPLDIHRKRIVIQFVYESRLIDEGKSIVDLSGADLIGAYLAGLVLTNANLSRTLLLGANLMATNLAGANLSEATLFGANLTSADLTGANLKEASISLKPIIGTEPTTNLFNANLTGANLSGARLCGADLRGTNLTGANLTGVDLTEANLTGAFLKGAIGITNEELEKQANSLKGATMPDGSKHP